VDEREEFQEFAVAVQGHLRRSAYLLCGDWHQAEDIVQTAFTRIFKSWRRVRAADSPDAYARQVVYRCYVDTFRKKRVATVPLETVPEPVVETSPDTLRDAVLEALALLAPGARAVVVLRFWEDMSVEQTASVLGISTGTVKSQTSRALGQLRARLASSIGESLAAKITPSILEKS
jgi:RNA polymerase sigma-70 factor (sigma-E family)